MSEVISKPKDSLHVQDILADGRVIALCSWADGEWKTEVFASLAHSLDFAAKHNMEVFNHASSSGA